VIAAVRNLATGASRLAARRLVVRGGLVVAVIAAAAAAPMASEAQGRVPDLNAPRRAAQKAADATDAATAAKTGQAVPAPGGPAAQRGAAPAPRSGPGSVPAVPAMKPALSEVAANVPPVTREVFAYAAEGRRDPFFSLILTEDLRPLLSDLKLVGILYEASGRRSVAIMRDVLTNAQYRVATGQTLGRMRVTQIKQKGVIFSIDEFGLSRQDSLVLTDTTKVRN
jgi:hypothetical protein